jgi:hypothetical protein
MAVYLPKRAVGQFPTNGLNQIRRPVAKALG